MRTNTIVGAMFTLLAVAACLTVNGCRLVGPTDPRNTSVVVKSAPGVPFFEASGFELFNVPVTWYCVSPWSDDRSQERRGIELFAWRLFIALNWPGRAPDDGPWKAERELSKLNSPGVYPRWNSWYTPGQIHDEVVSGSSYVPPGRGGPSGWRCDGDCLLNTLALSKGERMPGVAGQPSTTSPRLVYDQNGQAVRYEIRLDETWHETLMTALGLTEDDEDTEELARGLRGQPMSINFKHGQCLGQGPGAGDSYDTPGATEIKLAWKTLSEEEIKSGRFLQRLASPGSSSGGAGGHKVTLGLVGFHIAHKSKPYANWIWSTFEHVDNVVPAEAPGGPSFNDPTCDASTCRPNASKQVQVNGSTLCRTQITRVEPIPLEVQELNARARAWLQSNSTVLQYYQLVGVQYNQYDGSKPEPATLRNSVIETYMVGSGTSHMGASRGPCDIEPEATQSSCIGCHSEVRNDDFSFVVTRSLCNCEDRKNRWIGDTNCELLGVSSKCETDAPSRRAASR
ncbi:hypothetical protein WME99_50775 [Sorangium sp. So ce136]|uniref:hypothetical protein n=1 Tax=Sorangium sp. So ce136 TaxID=3133284 RepID=UPI003F0D9F1A